MRWPSDLISFGVNTATPSGERLETLIPTLLLVLKGNLLVIEAYFHSQDVFYRSLNEFYVMLKRENIEILLQSKIAAFLKANAGANLDKAKNNSFSIEFLDADEQNAWTINSIIASVIGAIISS
jgi:hypothetical protein